MPRLKTADQVTSLRRQQAEITARLREAEEAETKRQKEVEQRRVEVIGKLALSLVKDQPEGEFARLLIDAINLKVRRPSERQLFPDLPPLPSPKGKAGKQPETPGHAVHGGLSDDARAFT